MSDPRPVALRFFDSATTDKLASLCADLRIKLKVEEGFDGQYHVTTEPLTSTQRRDLIAKWSNITMERINE